MKFLKKMDSLPTYLSGKQIAGFIKLSSNENPLGPSPAALQAIRNASSLVHIYPPMVSEELQQAIASWRGVKNAQVICGNGSDEIFTLCAAAGIEKGYNAVGSENSFSQYRFATCLFGGEFRSIPTQNLAYDLEAMLSAVNSKTRLIFLCSPNNPTGLIIPGNELRWMLDRIPDYILVIIDQAYQEYVDDPSFISGAELVSKYPNVVVTGTFSKIFGLAALRLGYGLSQEENIRQLMRLKSPFNLNGQAIVAGLAALSDKSFLEESKKTNMASKSVLYTGLERLGLEFLRTEGNFITVRNPKGLDLLRLLQQQGIIIRDLSSFGLPEYVRITIPTLNLAETILSILAERLEEGSKNTQMK